jgi:hypothetical protein
MSTIQIRAKIRQDAVAEVEAAAAAMFAAIHAAEPSGVRYASAKLPDGVTFLVTLHLDGDQNPLTAIPQFNDFQAGIAGWLSEPPVVEPLQVVGSYRLY